MTRDRGTQAILRLLMAVSVALLVACATAHVHCDPATGELDVTTANLARVSTTTAVCGGGVASATVAAEEQSGWLDAAIAAVLVWFGYGAAP